MVEKDVADPLAQIVALMASESAATGMLTTRGVDKIAETVGVPRKAIEDTIDFLMGRGLARRVGFGVVHLTLPR